MNSFLNDVHFSDSVSDALLKFISWGLSFICILAFFIKNDSFENLASSYFVFSATVMADLAMRFLKKTHTIAKILNLILFLAFFYVSICAFLGLLKTPLANRIIDSLFIICIVFLILLLIDFILIYLFSFKTVINQANEGSFERKEEYLRVFEEKLKQKGN